VQTEDPDGRDPFTKNPFAFVVAGADRTFGGRLNVNTQYLFRYLFRASERTDRADFATAVAIQQHNLNGQTRRAQHCLSFRVSYNWLHETLEAECAAAAYARPSGAALRPKVAYALTDHWKVLAAPKFCGARPRRSFGLMRDNSTGYVELRYGF